MDDTARVIPEKSPCHVHPAFSFFLAQSPFVSGSGIHILSTVFKINSSWEVAFHIYLSSIFFTADAEVACIVQAVYILSVSAKADQSLKKYIYESQEIKLDTMLVFTMGSL